MSGIADGGITTSVGDDRPRGKRAPDARDDGVPHDAGAAAEVLGRDRGKGLRPTAVLANRARSSRALGGLVAGTQAAPVSLCPRSSEHGCVVDDIRPRSDRGPSHALVGRSVVVGDLHHARVR
jgi:hypothetical protein